jgi:hypothetical protein
MSAADLSFLSHVTFCWNRSVTLLDSTQLDEVKEALWKRILSVIIYLLFWALFTAIGLWLMFEMRGLIVEGMIAAELNPWAVRGYDRLVIFVLGLGWFVSLMWIEHYLRTAIEKKRLWRNIGRVAIVEAVLAALILAIRFLITS